METPNWANGYFCSYPFSTPSYDCSIDLRYNILRKPLGLSFTTDQLAQEWDQFHLGYFNCCDELLACLVLQDIDKQTIKMRQVAVQTACQNMGLGRLLVGYSEDVARSANYDLLLLHARKTAVPFYLALGYTLIDEPFEEIGIPHFKMLKQLNGNQLSR